MSAAALLLLTTPTIINGEANEVPWVIKLFNPVLAEEMIKARTCEDCGKKNILRFNNGDGKTRCELCATEFYIKHRHIAGFGMWSDTFHEREVKN